jgi:GDP-mannose 6-dehydrogenase
MMNVSVFGLGYVGSVSAGCMASEGDSVIGVDVDDGKVACINSGKSPVGEPLLDELIGSAVRAGRLRATTDSVAAVAESEVCLICVGTPSARNGRVNHDHIDSVCAQIGRALEFADHYYVVVVRSTVFPGTVEGRIIPRLEEHSGRQAGEGFGVCMIPEFLREGSGVKDYRNPPYVIIGELDQASGECAQRLYAGIAQAPVVRTTLRLAEMVKYASNAFHALKIAFANEIGVIAKEHGIDGRAVMDLVARDTILNASSAYLRPGFAFGGSCLPKDMRTLVHGAHRTGLDCPLLDAALESNRRHLERCIELVEASERRKVGILGLSFKAGTDDVRESPGLTLAETLLGRGYDVVVYDQNVDPSRLIGSNRAFLERELPHIASLMRDTLEDVLDEADVLIVTNTNPEYRQILDLTRPNHRVVDLVGLANDRDSTYPAYDGICW